MGGGGGGGSGMSRPVLGLGLIGLNKQKDTIHFWPLNRIRTLNRKGLIQSLRLVSVMGGILYGLTEFTVSCTCKQNSDHNMDSGWASIRSQLLVVTRLFNR